MPAMLEDSTAPPIYRTSGGTPLPNSNDPRPALPADVFPRQATLRDRVTVATVIPFSSLDQVPRSLLSYLSDQLNKEIETGDTYPMLNPMSTEQFTSYWFQNFGAIMLLGDIGGIDEVMEGKNWATECLGSFYIKPNYPGRSSHICNAGFLVTDAARNKGVGRLMGESYLEWAPRLGYVYSVFNLVYETNVASCRIWDALGFKRIGRVKGAGDLKSYPGQLIDAIIYGRDLGPEGEDFVSEERFDKIKFYLKYGKYPAGADRAEKSRLRSAATHYNLLPGTDKLMLKSKEVISDPQRQYEIARNVHILQHGGINKTTATIAEKYHWVRIKETVSLVIRNCSQCKELGKTPVVRGNESSLRPSHPALRAGSSSTHGSVSVGEESLSNSYPYQHHLQPQHHEHQHQHQHQLQHQPASDEKGFPAQAGQGSVSPQVLNRTLPQNSQSSHTSHPHSHSHQIQLHPPLQHPHHVPAPIARMADTYMPLDPQIMDPQIMEDVHHHLGGYESSSHHHHQPDHTQHHHGYEDQDQDHDSFQAMLSVSTVNHHHKGPNDGNQNPDTDLDMLIDQDGDGGVDGGHVDGSAYIGGNHRFDPHEAGAATGDDAVIHLHAEATARAAEEALRSVGVGGVGGV